MSSHSNTVNPYATPKTASSIEHFDAKSRVIPHWVAVVWDAILVAILALYVPSMVRATSSLFSQQQLDLQTISKLPERWVLAFFLLSLSAYLAVPRHVFLRVIYGALVVSFLFQHSPIGIGDGISAAIAAAVFLPMLTHGYGWLGVARSTFIGLVRRTARRRTRVQQAQPLVASDET